MARLKLARFRSYEFAELTPGLRSVALYGPNGAGKTNLLEAVSLLVPGRGLRRAASNELSRRPGLPGWRLRAELGGGAELVEIVTGQEGSEPRRTVAIDDTAVPQTRLGEVLATVWLTPAMDRLWTEGAADRRRFLDRMTLGFAPGHAEAALVYEKAMRERNRLLKEGRADPSWLSGLEGQMARAGARMGRARAHALDRLQAAQNRAETLFPKAELTILGDMETRFSEAIREGADLDSLESVEAASLAERWARERPRDVTAGRTLAGPHRSDLEAVYAAKAMPARLCSTGEQKALLISLCLANARALKEERREAPVLLLDEVAAHLDRDRRRGLYAEIEALGAQVWMTATGPELFDGLGEALRLEVREEDGRSVLGETA